MKEFLNKEITMTVGSQLIWLLSSGVILLILNTSFKYLYKTFIKKIKVIKDKHNKKKVVIEKKAYKKIKKRLKKSVDKMPERFLPGMPMEYFMKNESDEYIFSYAPLERLVREHNQTYEEKLRKYFIENPQEYKKYKEKLMKWQENVKNMENTMDRMANLINKDNTFFNE